jgi:mersacidin/lichenicidin family type 2 lantibiotic
MKFDVVRAWKDEAYCQSLNDEQLHALPANPAGELELSDDQLEAIFGGGHSVGIATAAYTKHEVIRSYALICEINIYSIDIEILKIDLISIGDPRCKVCAHHG